MSVREPAVLVGTGYFPSIQVLSRSFITSASTIVNTLLSYRLSFDSKYELSSWSSIFSYMYSCICILFDDDHTSSGSRLSVLHLVLNFGAPTLV